MYGRSSESPCFLGLYGVLRRPLLQEPKLLRRCCEKCTFLRTCMAVRPTGADQLSHRVIRPRQRGGCSASARIALRNAERRPLRFKRRCPAEPIAQGAFRRCARMWPLKLSYRVLLLDAETCQSDGSVGRRVGRDSLEPDGSFFEARRTFFVCWQLPRVLLLPLKRQAVPSPASRRVTATLGSTLPFFGWSIAFFASGAPDLPAVCAPFPAGASRANTFDRDRMGLPGSPHSRPPDIEPSGRTKRGVSSARQAVSSSARGSLTKATEMSLAQGW